MRELSVYFCIKCGHYAYFQLAKNAVCHDCQCAMTQLSMSYRDFMALDYEARDRLIVTEMIRRAPSLAERISAPEKMYQQRKLVGALTDQIVQLEAELKKKEETIEWMHALIWDELRKKQALKEELRSLKESAASVQPDLPH